MWRSHIFTLVLIRLLLCTFDTIAPCFPGSSLIVGDGCHVAIRTQEAPLSPTSAFNRCDSTICYTSCRPIMVTTSPSSPSSPSSPRMLIIRPLTVDFARWKAASLFHWELAVAREERGNAEGKKSRRDYSYRRYGNERACRDSGRSSLDKTLRWSAAICVSRDESESTRSSWISGVETRRSRLDLLKNKRRCFSSCPRRINRKHSSYLCNTVEMVRECK